MADRELLSELRAIAERSAKAADAAGPDVFLLRAFELEAVPGVPSDRGMHARLIELLMELSGWATGVRLAFETFEEEPPSRD